MPSPDKYRLAPILERSVVGDPQALNLLLTQLRPYLHDQVRSRLGPQRPGLLDASSVVQTSLLRIYQHFDQLRQPTVPHLLAWISRIARNTLIDALRKKGRERTQPVGSSIDDVPAREEEPSTAPDLGPDQRPRLLAALEQLPERQQQVVRWRFFDRLSDAEISRRLGGSVGAIRVLRCRALRRLKCLMEDAADA
jgi:RNA polymerase sigma factor (sigma-70 family)